MLACNSDATSSMFVTAETDFGLNMLRQSPVTEPLVVSPISVIFALALVQAGAKGKTKSQINKVISNGATDDTIVSYYSSLSSQVLQATDGVQSRIANGFFMDKKYTIEKQYQDLITKKYRARVEALDFAQAENAARIIDAFVSETTAGKIKDLITADTVRDAFAIIVNAIYFTAEWEHKFYKSSTANGTFYAAANAEKEIEFMNEFDENRLYTENEDVQVLSLRYKDTAYAFNIFLPKQRFALDALRKKLDGSKIHKLLSGLRSTYISLTIPKMKIETDFKLKDALIAMGVTEMFSDNADLTGITKAPPLKVSDAAHKAIIEVDEEGTTAAAVTTFKIVPLSARLEQPVRFVADHPFIFILTRNNNPLFMGQFV